MPGPFFKYLLAINSFYNAHYGLFAMFFGNKKPQEGPFELLITPCFTSVCNIFPTVCSLAVS